MLTEYLQFNIQLDSMKTKFSLTIEYWQPCMIDPPLFYFIFLHFFGIYKVELFHNASEIMCMVA